ncbi:dTDP-4-dehydrorhamnose 3,5-epimerase [Microvirga sp. W0021]|uniref:dTDP-4-dehydrorhamnose 3,5-epimerase n=1 Tax=Hohaiivirga grylli TaxID=3133970 RepID=A0ABV0BK06_9HYPH
MIEIEKTALDGVIVITPRRFGDARGWFSETWNDARLREVGLDLNFIQDNQSYSAPRGTLRGLHFQTNPVAQDKLVRVVRGAIIDVAVDLRKASPTFGKHVAVELTAENGKQLLVPKGFAHGFITTVPDTEVFYKVTAPYSPENDKGLAFNDPALGIDWGMPESELTLSDKDKLHPVLADLPDYF